MWRALGIVVRQAPALLAAADALLAGARQRRAAASAATDIESLRQRLAALEQHQQANAELMKQLAEHATAITAAAQANAARSRQAFVLAIASVTLALIALLLVWLQ